MGKKEIGSSEKIWGKYVQGHTDNKRQPLDLNHGLNIHALNQHDYKFRNSEFLNPKRVMFFTSPILTSPELYTQSCPITTCSVWVLQRGWVAWRRVVEVEERGRKRNRTCDSMTEQLQEKKRLRDKTSSNYLFYATLSFLPETYSVSFSSWRYFNFHKPTTHYELWV